MRRWFLPPRYAVGLHGRMAWAQGHVCGVGGRGIYGTGSSDVVVVSAGGGSVVTVEVVVTGASVVVVVAVPTAISLSSAGHVL